MPKINPALTEYALSMNSNNTFLRGMNHEECEKDIDDVMFEELLKFGVIFPYADAFSFNGKGVLLVGESGIGKTPIIKFLMAELFSEDNPLVYQPESSVNPIVFEGEGEAYKPFLGPFITEKYYETAPINYIFHLIESEERQIQRGDISKAIDYMLFEGVGYHKTTENKKRLIKMFEQVICFDILKRYGYKSDRELHETAASIEKILNSAKAGI